MADVDTPKSIAITYLTDVRDDARTRYFTHVDPGGLTPAEKRAWDFENFAYLLLLQAAQIKLDAEIELQRLLDLEMAA